MASLAVPRFHSVCGEQRTIRMKRLGANETISTCAFTLELCITGTSFIDAAIITWMNDNMTSPFCSPATFVVVCPFNFAECRIFEAASNRYQSPIFRFDYSRHSVAAAASLELISAHYTSFLIHPYDRMVEWRGLIVAETFFLPFLPNDIGWQSFKPLSLCTLLPSFVIVCWPNLKMTDTFMTLRRAALEKRGRRRWKLMRIYE